MCAGLLAQTPEEPKEPKPAVSLDQEFSINATIYSARAWLSNDETFHKRFGRLSLRFSITLASPSYRSVCETYLMIQ